MFGGASTTQPQHSQPQLNPPPAPADLPTAEEEALKKNTDCVYFLASPLTCKKGSECEYRHSDIARLNPRDCWYWLNGNCLNPKCAFRHPPLDGLLGIQPPTPLGPTIPPPQAATTPVAHAHNSGKQGVPCVFFQKGYCLKGDRCPFLHPFHTNKVGPTLPAADPTPVNEPPAVKISSAFNEKPVLVQKVSQGNAPKPVELPSQPKLAVRFQTNFSSINGISDKYGPPSTLSDERPRYRPTNVAPTTQGDSVKRSNMITPNGKDMDELSREPSPGFDVLVDDDLRESGYYPNEDQFGRTRGGHAGRNMNALNDYEIGSSADYNSIVDGDHDIYHDHPHGYDSYERLQGQYGWEEHRLSSERLAGDPPDLERRRHHPRADSPDRVEESDLRNLLAKQRRGNNGLRSGVSRDHPRDNRGEDRNYRSAQRESLQESSVSSRLRGRIKMPGRSTSPINDNYLHSNREMERGRSKGRFSPERQPMTSHQGRLRDRIKGRVQDDFNNDGRNLLGSRVRRDVITDNGTEFHGPKRLSVLKVGKNNTSESSDQSMTDRSSIGKRKFPQLQSDTSVSFEGPKPLSEILKRKRGSEVGVPVPKGSKENLVRNTETAPISGDTGIADQEFASEKVKADVGQSSVQHNASDEEGMINDGGIEEYDQREGGEYEDEEEEYNIRGENENENAAELEEDEYLEEEDEGDDADDFAKKMGVMYS